MLSPCLCIADTGFTVIAAFSMLLICRSRVQTESPVFVWVCSQAPPDSSFSPSWWYYGGVTSQCVWNEMEWGLGVLRWLQWTSAGQHVIGVHSVQCTLCFNLYHSNCIKYLWSSCCIHQLTSQYGGSSPPCAANSLLVTAHKQSRSELQAGNAKSLNTMRSNWIEYKAIETQQQWRIKLMKAAS